MMRTVSSLMKMIRATLHLHLLMSSQVIKMIPLKSLHVLCSPRRYLKKQKRRYL